MKRFYKTAEARQTDNGWTVVLDGRPIRTPAKAPFKAPNAAVAEAAAGEWYGQEGTIKPSTMPITRSVNTAIDRTLPEFDQVVDMVSAYGGSDLICYRAVGPEALVLRQSEAWGPLITWAEQRFGARLLHTTGVMHILQPEEDQAQLAEAVRQFDSYALTALYDLVALSGSLVIGLAVAEGHVSHGEGWALSRVDETWQAEQWGVDEDAAALAVRKSNEFAAAAHFIDLLKQS
jgi:chaperone required for assembly of F1-ATPase